MLNTTSKTTSFMVSSALWKLLEGLKPPNPRASVVLGWTCYKPLFLFSYRKNKEKNGKGRRAFIVDCSKSRGWGPLGLNIREN